jgi:hypothetical protein
MTNKRYKAVLEPGEVKSLLRSKVKLAGGQANGVIYVPSGGAHEKSMFNQSRSVGGTSFF